MARAKRHYLYGYVWHITHRCHKKEFLLKLVKDRQRWLSPNRFAWRSYEAIYSIISYWFTGILKLAMGTDTASR
jgi:hypothetical protein